MTGRLTRDPTLMLSALGLAALTLLVKRGRTAAVDRRWAARVGAGKPLGRDVSLAAKPKIGFVEALVVAALPRLRLPERALALIAPSLAGLVGHALKRMVPRRRPGWAGLPRNGKQSFPSTHAAHAASLALAAARVARKHGAGPWADLVALGVVAVVSFARLRAKAHWPSDVLAGALLGLASARLAQHGAGVVVERRPARPSGALN